MRRVRIANVASYTTSERPAHLFLHPRCHHPSLFRRSGWRWQSTDTIDNGSRQKEELGARSVQTPGLARQPIANASMVTSARTSRTDRSIADQALTTPEKIKEKQLEPTIDAAERNGPDSGDNFYKDEPNTQAVHGPLPGVNTPNSLILDSLNAVRAATALSKQSQTISKLDSFSPEKMDAIQSTTEESSNSPDRNDSSSLASEELDFAYVSDSDLNKSKTLCLPLQELDSVGVVTSEQLGRLKTWMHEHGECFVDYYRPNLTDLRKPLQSDVDTVRASSGHSPKNRVLFYPNKSLPQDVWKRLLTFWNLNMELLNAQHVHSGVFRPDLSDGEANSNKHVTHVSEVAAERVAKVLMAAPPEGVDAIGYMREIWSSKALFNFSEPARCELSLSTWCNTMLWVLDLHPNAAVQVLLATYTNPHPPWGMVAAALNNLASHYLQQLPKYSHSETDYFRYAVSHLVQMCVGDTSSLSQHTIWLILTRSTLSHTESFYRLLLEHNCRLTFNSLLHFAYFFGKHGEFELALEALSKAADAGAPVTGDVFLSVCNHILRFSVTHPEGYHSSSYIVGRIMATGGQMNQILYNVLMTNAAEAGDMKTALRVYNLLEENGIEPDDYTLSILLNGCKRSEDRQLVANVLRKADEMVMTSRSAWLATDILHATYLQHMPRLATTYHAKIAYKRIMPLYRKYFRTGPLLELGIFSNRFVDKMAGELKLEPPPAAINIVLAALLRMAPNSNDVDLVFERFIKAIHGDASRAAMRNQMIELTLTTHTYNIFLLAFSHKAENLKKCTALVHMMSMGLPAKSLPLDTKTKKRIYPAKPDAFMFNTLIYAFTRHGQTAAAKKVMDLMEKRGLKRDYVSWSTLVNGFVMAKDVQGVAESVRGMEREGFEMGRAVVDSFRRVGQREELMAAWEGVKRREEMEESGSERDGQWEDGVVGAHVDSGDPNKSREGEEEWKTKYENRSDDFGSDSPFDSGS